jgi:hypothetical protein
MEKTKRDSPNRTIKEQKSKSYRNEDTSKIT